jgi:nucleoside-diphosphate-sugar epimerase
VPFLTLIARIRNEDPLYTFGSLKILKINNRNISSDKAKKELDFQSRSTDTTISDTLEWFKEMRYIVKY